MDLAPTKRFTRRRIVSSAVALGVLGVGAFCLAAWVLRPFPADLLEPPPGTIQVVDRDGRVLRDVLGPSGQRSFWVGRDGIADTVVDATLAGEDHRFAVHPGVDPYAVVRAVVINLEHGKIYSGASTITMQLVRLLRGERRGSVVVKVEEALAALQLEASASKEEILVQYLNRVPYGRGAVGIEAASRRYLGKSARHLTLGEAASLAVLPRGPRVYDPVRHPRRHASRRKHILRLMADRGTISAEELVEALAEEVILSPRPPAFAAPHFADWVVAKDLPRLQGRPATVRTTLSLDLQREVEFLVESRLVDVGGDGVEAAVVVVDNETGGVLALVGSGSYLGGSSGQVNGALAPRQPGSTLKPFVYGLAFEAGAGPATVVADIPTGLSLGTGIYVPRNFDGRFRGPVSIRRALSGSLNVPAVRVTRERGVEPLLHRLRLAGLETLDLEAEHYGLALALGNGEVTLVDLTGAYAMLARGGRWRPLRTTLDSRASSGAVRPLGAVVPSRRAFSGPVSAMVTDVLSDDVARMATFGRATPFRFPFDVAVKTGTSAGYRDSWALGYSRQITVGVWVGRFDGAPMDGVTGARGAGPLFAAVMERAMAGRAGLEIEPHDGLVKAEVCPLSGLRPSDSCPHRTMELFAPRATPDEHCQWHVELAVDVSNGLLAGSSCTTEQVRRAVFVSLPAEYSAWSLSAGLATAPTAYSERCPGDEGTGGGKAPEIVSPVSGEVFLLDPSRPTDTQTIAVKALAPGEVRWVLNGEPADLERLTHARGLARARWAPRRGLHRLEAVNSRGRRASVEFEVR